MTDREVHAAIDAGATDVTTIAAWCGAGTDCGGCHSTIERILSDCGACPRADDCLRIERLESPAA